MRWFAAALVVALVFAIDRAFFDGQSAAMLLSLLRRGATAFNQEVADLLRWMRT
jgi:hypothetical protein